MTLADGLLVAAVVLLLVLAALLAMAEVALSRVSRVRVEELVRESRRGARRLQQVLADPPGYLNSVALVRGAFETTAAVVATVVLIKTVHPQAAAAATSATAVTVVGYLFARMWPRTVGLRHADTVALRSAGLVIVLAKVLSPITTALVGLGNLLTPGRPFRDGPFTTEAELRDLVDLAEERHLIESGERQMIHGVFELGDTIVREVMVPRTEIVFIERSKTLRQALSLCLRSGFSRIPVIGESEDDVCGLIYLKDVVRRVYDARESEHTVRVEEILREPFFVPDSKPVDGLLREMQARRTHVAMVVDEYGGTAGIVTIEDILEEIVGEITDEYDRESPPVEWLDADTVRVTARLPVEDLAELLGVDLGEHDVETVGGLLASALGRVPIPGATATSDGLVLIAESSAGRRNRITTVLVRRETPASDGDVSDDARSGSGAAQSLDGRQDSGGRAGRRTAEDPTEAADARP